MSSDLNAYSVWAHSIWTKQFSWGNKTCTKPWNKKCRFFNPNMPKVFCVCLPHLFSSYSLFTMNVTNKPSKTRFNCIFGHTETKCTITKSHGCRNLLIEAGRRPRKWQITNVWQWPLKNVRGSAPCHGVKLCPFHCIKYVLSSLLLTGFSSPTLLCVWHFTVCGCIWSPVGTIFFWGPNLSPAKFCPFLACCFPLMNARTILDFFRLWNC